MADLRNIRIDGVFTLKAPMSHIGETISNSSYLVQEKILQDDGTVEEVFAYSGNAWRGQLRDLSAAYMLDRLNRPEVSLDMFHLLFSGGRIGGAQSTDIDQARRLRAAIPMLSLFGGGVGNQLLAGKMRVGSSYPLCRQAIPVLPKVFHPMAEKIDYADLTFQKELSRRDDGKNDEARQYLPPPDITLLPGAAGTEAAARKQRREEGPADQMRMRMELVTPGTRLASFITLSDVTDAQIGCLVAALHAFSRNPFIGGQSARGFGLVDLEYRFRDTGTGETVDQFLTVADGESLLAPEAQAAKDAYDQHLRGIYDAMLAKSGSDITALLGAA